MGPVPELLEVAVVLRAKVVRLEQMVEFAVVASVEGDGDARPQHRFRSVQEFGRR